MRIEPEGTVSSNPKEFHCKRCGAQIMPDVIKSDRLLIVCSICHAAHAPIDFYDKQPETERHQQIDMDMPAGITVERGKNQEVERFAVKVGNDTDPFRQPHYKTIRCWVAKSCNLSKNSIRVLQQMFGEVNYVTLEPISV
jgi:hypothetical protein